MKSLDEKHYIILRKCASSHEFADSALQESSVANLIIEQIDSNNQIVEQWTVKNPFIKSVKFGDLAYGEEDLVNVDVSLSYDYATYSSVAGGVPIAG